MGISTNNVIFVLKDAATPGLNEIYKTGKLSPAGLTSNVSNPNKSIQVFGSTSSGVGAARVSVEYSNVEAGPYLPPRYIDLVLDTTPTTDGYTLAAEWAFIKFTLVSISGTGAKVTALVGV